MIEQQNIFAEVDIIAELANAHDGNYGRASEIISSVSTVVDAAKIQMFSADDIAVRSHENYSLYQDLSLSAEDVAELVETAHNESIYLFADILGSEGLSRASESDLDGYKIHSSDLTNHQLIKNIAREGKPTIISAGGASLLEIRNALSSFEGVTDSEVGFVYGFQNYPTDLDEANLNRLQSLISEFGEEYPVGYTSHVDGGLEVATKLPAWAVAAGAEFVEIHTTLDRSIEGPDYYSSLEPDNFKTMAENVAMVRRALGSEANGMSESELQYRDDHKKCVVASENLHIEDTIREDDIALKRPRHEREGVYYDLDAPIGMQVANPIEKGEPVSSNDLTHTVAATLACRAESTRLYGKPLQLIGNEPILGHLVSQLQDTNSLDYVVLAISDTPSKSAFIDFAENRDLPYVVGDEEDVLGRIIKATEAVEADLSVRVTTENPFIYEKSVDDQIELAIDRNADLVVTRNLPLGSYLEVASARALKRSHEYGEDRHRSELVTSFITENPHSFDIVGIEPPNVLNRPDIRLTVDYPSDLILVRKLWEHVSNNEDPYKLERIIATYDEKELQSINESKFDGKSMEVVDSSWHLFGEPEDKMTIVK